MTDKNDKTEKSDYISKITNALINYLFPTVLNIWIVFLYIQLIVFLFNKDYSAYAYYAQIALTLFGFTLVGTFFGNKTLDKKAVKRLVGINLNFLISAISFLVVYACTGFISFVKNPDLYNSYLVTIIFFIFVMIGLFTLTFSTFSLFRFLKDWYKSIIDE